MYLQEILSGSIDLLHNSLDLSVSQFPTSTKLEWLMERQEFLKVPLKPSESANPDNLQSVKKEEGASREGNIYIFAFYKLSLLIYLQLSPKSIYPTMSLISIPIYNINTLYRFPSTVVKWRCLCQTCIM